MDKEKASLSVLMVLLLALMVIPYTFPRYNYNNEGANINESVTGIVDELYSKVSEDSSYYKADILSYTDDGFKLAVVKDVDRSYGILKIFTKTNTGNYRELEVNTNNIVINVISEKKTPYAEIKFSSVTSTKNIAEVVLYLPNDYSIDIYSDNDSIQYKITEYLPGDTQ